MSQEVSPAQSTGEPAFIPEEVAALKIEQMSVAYESIPALWDITLSVPQGKMTAIIGPNGAGKSTLLSALVGRLHPTTGCARFWDRSIEQVRCDVAYVPQRESVDWSFPMTVQRLAQMGRYPRLGWFKRFAAQDHIAVAQALKRVEMESMAQRQISQLSGGQQQRAFIARALAQEADLYLMDEPFAAVDLATEKRLIMILRQLCSAGKSVFVVHHDLNTLRDYFDWVIMLNVRLVASGPTDEVFNEENIEKTYGKPVSLLQEMARAAAEVSPRAL